MTEGPRLSPWALKNFNRFVPSLPPASCFLASALPVPVSTPDER